MSQEEQSRQENDNTHFLSADEMGTPRHRNTSTLRTTDNIRLYNCPCLAFKASTFADVLRARESVIDGKLRING